MPRFGVTRESTANARISGVRDRLSSRIQKLEVELSNEKTSNKANRVGLLTMIQSLAITRGDPNPELLAKINAKFIELGGDTTPEENRRLVAAAAGMNMDDLFTLLIDGVKPRAIEGI